jgi:hypothetical protein
MKNSSLETSRNIIQNLKDSEWKYTSSDESRIQYLQDHKNRFEKTISICKNLVPNKKSRILDVGRSYFTGLLSKEYEDVWSIGFGDSVDIGGHRSYETEQCKIQHIEFDLNNSKYLDRWPKVKIYYDLIVYAETIEHLMVAPEYSLLCLSTLLAPKGILLLTTPNAVTFSKRLRLFSGKNPFEQIRLLSENPGHFREYTLDELCAIGSRCNLKICYRQFVNFYNHKDISKIIFKNIIPSFRDSLVVGFKK